MMRFLRAAFARFGRREEGTATAEFVIAVPVLITIFLASVESGLYMIRWVSMDRALDLVMRDVRLGNMPGVTHAQLRAAICEQTTILHDCESLLRVELLPVDPDTWALPPAGVACVNRAEDIEPVLGPVGEPSQPMLVRLCVVQDPIFPTTGMGLRMKMEGQDGYALVTTSLYANEPN